jgi:hypothetical protein
MDRKRPSASDPSSPQTGQQIQIAQVQAASHKVFSRTNEDGPAPLFVNNIEFAGVGMDVYMDVGTVSPESIRDAWTGKSTGQQPTVKFNADFRFGMSLQTAALMLQRLVTLMQASSQFGPGVPSMASHEGSEPKTSD